MEAKQNSITRFMQQQDTQFIIPVYQRNYDWRDEHCRQLFNDIQKVASSPEDSTHFVGSIVYLQANITSTPIYLTVIDGQQRLTTLMLIWIALYRRALEWENDNLANQIEKKFLINEFLEETAKVKLRPIKKDDKALQHLLSGSGDEWADGYSRLIENYTYFYDSITPEMLEILPKGINRLVFIDVALERGKDDPQRIFQSLNSTGLDLSQADLIRNYVLLDLDPAVQGRIYESYWRKIELNTQEISRKESRLSDFIRDFLTFRHREIPNKGKVFVTFKAKYDRTDMAHLEPLLNDLLVYSRYFSRLLEPSREENAGIAEELANINHLSIGCISQCRSRKLGFCMSNEINNEIPFATHGTNSKVQHGIYSSVAPALP